MDSLIELILFPAAAGACILIGGLVARVERIHPSWLEQEFRHFVIAFGGGVILAAVCLVLLPQGIESAGNTLIVMISFATGGLVFFGLERVMGLHRQGAPQFMAMLLDYIPESLALGGILAAGAPGGKLLAVLIGLQNLPEGFNSYRELVSQEDHKPIHVLILMASMILIGPVLALVGWWYLSSHPQMLGAIMLFASGGILYLIFQDIAPQAQLRNHWFPSLGAVCGFALGLLGELLIGGA